MRLGVEVGSSSLTVLKDAREDDGISGYTSRFAIVVERMVNKSAVNKAAAVQSSGALRKVNAASRER